MNSAERRAIKEAAKLLSRLPAHKMMAMLKAQFGNLTGKDRAIRAATKRPSSVRPKTRSVVRGRTRGGEIGQVISELMGRSPKEFSNEVAKLAAGGTSSGFMRELLKDLGPAGKALQAIVGAQDLAKASVSKSAIDEAIALLQGAGFEVRMPKAPAPDQPATARPPKTGKPAKPNTAAPGDSEEPAGEVQGPQQAVGVFPGGLYVPMEQVQSSNVYAIGYSEATLTMRVQYLGTALSMAGISGSGHAGKGRVRGKRGKTVTGQRSGAGPTYDYHGVPPRVFERVRSAGSKGKAIWDQLRIRGTAYGHKFDYELVAASVADVLDPGGRKVARVTYVPRKAAAKGVFHGRTMRQGVGSSAREFRSLLPNQRGR